MVQKMFSSSSSCSNPRPNLESDGMFTRRYEHSNSVRRLSPERSIPECLLPKSRSSSRHLVRSPGKSTMSQGAPIAVALSSISFIHLSRTGFIFWADFGVISNFSNRHIALCEYDGPSVADSARPTCVWVRPNDKRRILNARAKFLISSKSIPSTMFASVELITVRRLRSGS